MINDKQKVLLCGNGINIQFNKKFNLSEFIDLLQNKNNELKYFYMSLPYNIFNPSNTNELEDFIYIINKYKNRIEEQKKELFNAGVEEIFLKIFEYIERDMRWEKDEVYNNFEKTFKKIFFKYIAKLENEQFYSYSFNSTFENRFNYYEKVITLNYDTILENKFKTNEKKIIHWHGAIKKDKNGNLDYSNCLLDTLRNPKTLQSFPQLPIFKNYNKNANSIDLDIVGLNPLNDENVFILFINSQICNMINFYYHTQSDILNLNKILNKIKNKTIITENNKIKLTDSSSPTFTIKEITEKQWNLNFKSFNNENNIIKINLIHSYFFWNKSNNESEIKEQNYTTF